MAHEFFASLFHNVSAPFQEQVATIVSALDLLVHVELSICWEAAMTYHFVATITAQEE